MQLYQYSVLLLAILMSCNTNVDQKSEYVKEAKVVTSIKKEVENNVEKENKKDIVETLTFSFDLTYLMGKFDPVQQEDFVEMSTQYAQAKGMYLRKDAYEAFKKMHQAAKADGVSLQIRSATRNFNRQKQIWEAKWTGKRLVDKKDLSKAIPDAKARALKILEYSSMPGTSRHHWGTDIDINAFVNSYFEKGKGLKEYEWLVANAADYGFCQPYTPKGAERPHGYNEEKWHWSYIPVAKKLTDQAKAQLNEEMLNGFKGSEAAAPIGVVEKYVLGINKSCL